MNIFLVCFPQVSCTRLIQPVEVYISWYMMWYLKKIFSAGNISFSTDASFFEQSVHCPFFVQSVHHPLVCPLSIIQQTCSMSKSFVHSTHVFVCTLVLAIACVIVCTIMCICKISLIGPGIKPLTFQRKLFVGPGFDSQAQSPV